MSSSHLITYDIWTAGRCMRKIVYRIKLGKSTFCAKSDSSSTSELYGAAFCLIWAWRRLAAPLLPHRPTYAGHVRVFSSMLTHVPGLCPGARAIRSRRTSRACLRASFSNASEPFGLPPVFQPDSPSVAGVVAGEAPGVGEVEVEVVRSLPQHARAHPEAVPVRPVSPDGKGGYG